MCYQLIKKILFQFDAELSHDSVALLMHLAPQLFGQHYHITADISVDFGDFRWRNPIGIAAGFDKNALLLTALDNLGAGAIEIGTVTEFAQAGNDRPRIQRLVDQKTILNRMGFPSHGMKAVKYNLFKTAKTQASIGINIGKNKLTIDEQDVIDQHLNLLHYFSQEGDYHVINISSPNTEGLRAWQDQRPLASLLSHVATVKSKPLFLKIAPDLNFKQLESIVELATDYHLAGIIATNTTQIPTLGQGGFSGKILAQKASQVRKEILQLTQSTPLKVIGVGGIDSIEDIYTFFAQGGDAVQLYTGLVYQGPHLIMQLLNRIQADIYRFKLKNLDELKQKLKAEYA
jgi:dihydroorotate dehydrogenase